MSRAGPPFPPRGKLIRVTGGIRARARRGRIGEQWWSRRFIEVLESFPLAGRLARGRSYARQGQVVTLRVDAGEVSATVQGTAATPYQVRIGLPVFPEPLWSRIESELVAQAIYSARLLAGEMPPDLEDVFVTAGAPLFPRTAGELDMACSCPDPAVPCKHLAATLYLLAEAFDDDPFRILQWRGREREALLGRLRQLRADPPADQPLVPADPALDAPVVGAARALSEVTSRPLADGLDRFWLPPVPLPPRPATLPAAPDLLLRQLATPPASLGGQELADDLHAAYRRFGEGRYREGV